jgi:LuxR family transcriptional regulator, maltose regulon positive regulatory protein
VSSPAPAFEVLEAKLRAPQGRGGAVPRTALIDLLEERPSAFPVVFVSAGPGWGKTTLLAQWDARSQRPFAWVSVDEGDNDPIVLLTYVATALDRVAKLDPGVFEALASPGASLEGQVVPRIGAALAELDQPVVLVVDDLHLLDHTACLDAIAALARHVRDGSQLALSARGRPALPLGSLRARGLAREVGPDELRLDEAEAGRLLSAAGLDLEEAEVAELTAHTEGWSAGLYLAALSAKATGAGANGPTAFRGDDSFLADYLRSELLARLPPGELRFLTRTSILVRMSGPLCDAVLDASGSAAELESLESSNLFVVALDRNRQWYRYHHLFQELLRSELERAEADLVPRLLARASGWCEANGQPEAAIGYAQEAGDVDRVAQLVALNSLPAYQSGRSATVERWLRWLEEHGGGERDAAVAVIAGLYNAISGRAAEADRWSDAAERASYEGTLPDGSASIDAWRALLRAQRCRQGVARMRADAELAVATLARGSQFWPNALLLLGVARLMAGEVDEADELFADVVEEGVALGAADGVAVALSERAAIAVGRGAWVQAEELTNRAVRFVRQTRTEEYTTSAIVHALAARVALHRGDAPGAEDFLARAQRQRLRLTHALPHLATQTRLELARAYLMRADAAGVSTMLREIDAILRRQPDLGTLGGQADELRASLTTMRAEAPGASTLTEAELRLLPYLGTHLSFREVGERLFVSRHTVKSHAMAVYRKLNVTSRNEAVERSRALGLL